MKIRVYISTYDYTVDGETAWASHLRYTGEKIPGEQRYQVDIEVPDRVPVLDGAEATQVSDWMGVDDE